MKNNVYYKDDRDYPELLKQINKEAPKQIYFKALASSFSQELFSSPCLSVVGSRKLTSYGRQAGEQIISQIAASGITIISGFMYGGDALAHQTAVNVNGRTIAVMPCGIDCIHPQDQKDLYQDILDNQGMIISEYEGDMKPALWTYPRRNRIVAGLSQALLIIEAGEKSGTLITANYAKKFKRKIFALPGPITGSVSKGTNMLIKQGVAEMVTCADDILGWFKNINKNSRSDFLERFSPKGTLHDSKKSKTLFNTEKKIINILKREPMSIDELSRELDISSSKLGVKLSLMEMQGMIILRGSKYFNK